MFPEKVPFPEVVHVPTALSPPMVAPVKFNVSPSQIIAPGPASTNGSSLIVTELLIGLGQLGLFVYCISDHVQVPGSNPENTAIPEAPIGKALVFVPSL